MTVHCMLQTRVRVVVHVVRQHHPDLPIVFVGDGHDHLAEMYASVQCACPKLFGYGLFSEDGLGALQAVARAMDPRFSSGICLPVHSRDDFEAFIRVLVPSAVHAYKSLRSFGL